MSTKYNTRHARVAKQDMEQAARTLRSYTYKREELTARCGAVTPRENSLSRYWAQQSVWVERHAGAVAAVASLRGRYEGIDLRVICYPGDVVVTYRNRGAQRATS